VALTRDMFNTLHCTTINMVHNLIATKVSIPVLILLLWTVCIKISIITCIITTNIAYVNVTCGISPQRQAFHADIATNVSMLIGALSVKSDKVLINNY